MHSLVELRLEEKRCPGNEHQNRRSWSGILSLRTRLCFIIAIWLVRTRRSVLEEVQVAAE